MKVINRVLSAENEVRMKRDFSFLTKLMEPLSGELDVFLREDYFNIYYKGNSLAKVTFRPDDHYDVGIHSKFFKGSSAESDGRFSFRPGNNGNPYCTARINKSLLHPLFQHKNIAYFKSRIKEIAYQEELVIEQQIINDNRSHNEVIIVDRQVTDKIMKRRMDLLAVRRTENGHYNFVVLEVKLGNNKELKGAIVDQMQYYMSHLEDNFADYRDCYESNYAQSVRLGLALGIRAPNSIKITGPVKGLVLAVGYSGLAHNAIAELESKYPPSQWGFELQKLNLRIS